MEPQKVCSKCKNNTFEWDITIPETTVKIEITKYQFTELISKRLGKFLTINQDTIIWDTIRHSYDWYSAFPGEDMKHGIHTLDQQSLEDFKSIKKFKSLEDFINQHIEEYLQNFAQNLTNDCISSGDFENAVKKAIETIDTKDCKDRPDTSDIESQKSDTSAIYSNTFYYRYLSKPFFDFIPQLRLTKDDFLGLLPDTFPEKEHDSIWNYFCEDCDAWDEYMYLGMDPWHGERANHTRFFMERLDDDMRSEYIEEKISRLLESEIQENIDTSVKIYFESEFDIEKFISDYKEYKEKTETTEATESNNDEETVISEKDIDEEPITLENIERHTKKRIQDENVKNGLARCENELKSKSIAKWKNWYKNSRAHLKSA